MWTLAFESIIIIIIALLLPSLKPTVTFQQIVTSSYTDLQDYTYYFVPAPWLCVKLLKLLQLYPPPGSTFNILFYNIFLYMQWQIQTNYCQVALCIKSQILWKNASKPRISKCSQIGIPTIKHVGNPAILKNLPS